MGLIVLNSVLALLSVEPPVIRSQVEPGNEKKLSSCTPFGRTSCHLLPGRTRERENYLIPWKRIQCQLFIPAKTLYWIIFYFEETR